MGLFSKSPMEKWLEATFKTSDLDEVVYRESMTAIAPEGATAVDLVVDVAPPAILERSTVIGLAYYPSGLVLKGVQNIKAGERRVFRNVLVKPGEELIVAMGAEEAVSVTVEKAGQTAASGGAATSFAKPGGSGNPLSDFFSGLGEGTGKVLVVAAIVAVVLYVAKEKAIAAV